MTQTQETDLSLSDFEFLDEAARFFADPGVIAKGLEWAGHPIESLQNRLPEKARVAIAVMSEKAIERALLAAVKTLPRHARETQDHIGVVGTDERERLSLVSSRVHRGLTALTGAAGGLFGLPSLAIELPVTTVLILRAISDQARLYGHDLQELETRLECLMVFAMGAPGDKKTGEGQNDSIHRYFMTRASFVGLMRRAVGVAGAFTAKEIAMSLEKGSAPLLAKMAARIAEKFEVRVSQKFLAESVPLLGAIGGGALNYAFTDFFVTTARYHFGIRALEKKYGEETIRRHFKNDVGAGA